LGQEVITTLQFEEQYILFVKMNQKQGKIVLIDKMPDIIAEICTILTPQGTYEDLNSQWLCPIEEREQIWKAIDETLKSDKR